jgi:hypothetical protein
MAALADMDHGRLNAVAAQLIVAAVVQRSLLGERTAGTWAHAAASGQSLWWPEAHQQLQCLHQAVVAPLEL